MSIAMRLAAPRAEDANLGVAGIGPTRGKGPTRGLDCPDAGMSTAQNEDR
jgi:hypothetical protein